MREVEREEIEYRLKTIEEYLWQIKHILERHQPKTPTRITFKEITMLPTQGGNTLVFTGTLAPAGAVYPSDTTFTVTSNDPAVSPTVDASGLVVTVALPAGWVESTTTPLAIAYQATSVSGPVSISATITHSAPVVLPTSIFFQQTT